MLQTLTRPARPSSASGAASAAEEWFRILAATAARSALALLCGAALWATAPALLGWLPTTVMTGSMQPRIQAGDVVVSRPPEREPIRAGQVLLFQDPDRPDRLRLHRVVRVRSGVLTTRGDANPAPDSSTVTRAAVRGVAVLRIPLIGAPVVWWREGRGAAVAGAAAVLVGLLLTSTLDLPVRRRRAGTGTAPRRGRAAGGRRRVVGGAVAVTVLAAAAGQLPAAAASAAPFTGLAVSTAELTAAVPHAVTDLRCSDGPGSAVTVSWSYSGNDPEAFELLMSGTTLATVPGSARSVAYTRTGLLNLGGRYALQVRTDLAGSWTATAAQTVSVSVLSILGLTSVSCG